ncbi:MULTISPECIES: type II secretion system minor pseudopilin GspI [Marinobacter]|uniref:Type II secretion system protein I n=1 Tax=Marinobacter profundi TaxID=2666256 RepID=A0A2G1UQU7_9GAMM|nr:MULTISPECIES: type II secretion system minor pseudopilin GspI [Marinobacter]MBD3655582.1 type II secretion system minor pseudopilin GspI [Marinobacter sp.]PHQ16868.1 type II secretion system protein GspI [Marinobacter profundi]
MGDRRHSGFTLIEVLVALLVFGLIATAASEVASQYINSYERVRDKTLASWIADNRMNEMRLAEALPGISETTDDLDFGQYRWQVTTAVLGTAEPTMRRVDVTVARIPASGSEPYAVHALSGFIGEP